jgi:hypothetical protein
VWLHYRIDSRTIKRGMTRLLNSLGVHFIIIYIWIELISPRKLIMKMLTHSHMTRSFGGVSTFAKVVEFER